MINSEKMLLASQKMAEMAKDGILKLNGKIYTFVFCQREYVYKVYEDGFFIKSYNTKKITIAKKWLKEYLEN